MVLLSLPPPPSDAEATAPETSPRGGTLARWHAEVSQYEQTNDGMVARGGRWLQRLERAREGEWLSSFGSHEERTEAMRLPAEVRRLRGEASQAAVGAVWQAEAVVSGWVVGAAASWRAARTALQEPCTRTRTQTP